jgi:hypothetical protein
MQPQIKVYKLSVRGFNLYGYPIKEAAIVVMDKKYYWQAVTAKNSYASTREESNLANAFMALKHLLTS